MAGASATPADAAQGDSLWHLASVLVCSLSLEYVRTLPHRHGGAALQINLGIYQETPRNLTKPETLQVGFIFSWHHGDEAQRRWHGSDLKGHVPHDSGPVLKCRPINSIKFNNPKNQGPSKVKVLRVQTPAMQGQNPP